MQKLKNFYSRFRRIQVFRQPRFAYIILALAFFLTSAILADNVRDVRRSEEQTRKLTEQNSELIVQIQELRRARVRTAAETDIRLCQIANSNRSAIKVNTLILKRLVGPVVAEGIENPRLREAFKKELATLEKQSKNLRPAKCKRLPSQEPFHEVKER